jgi:hypothetical protein
MLYELSSIYCSRCKEFTPVFDAVNYDFSATEILCSNCGRILLIMKTEYQTGSDLGFNHEEIESHVRRENQKSSKKAKIRKILSGIKTV